ncbi:MAG: type II secretion system protein GspC [Pseudomonadales bacterium]
MTGIQAAANFATVGHRVVGWLSGLPVKTLHNACCGLLILWLLLGFAQLVGLFIPSSLPENTQTEVAPPSMSASTRANNATPIDISQLQSLNLFGAAGAQTQPVAVTPVVEEEIKAVKTKLNLLLEGIAFTPVASESMAVIVYQGKQDQYHIGEKLPVGGQVTLAQVLMDHVIIDNKGRYESLWLYDDDKKHVSNPARTVRPVAKAAGQSQVKDMRSNTNATNLARDYRQRLYKNPGSLGEVLRISPAQKDGEMIGYRVSPGKDRAQFTELGFKTNDIVTRINGIELNEPSKALEIYKLMRTAKEASFTVDRNGETIQLMVSLNATE